MKILRNNYNKNINPARTEPARTEEKTYNLEKYIAIENHLRNFENKNKVASNSICEWIFRLNNKVLKCQDLSK